MRGERLLQQALQIFEERRAQYGNAERHMVRVAKRWSLVLGFEISEHEVVRCLLELKLERLSFDPTHMDSIVDVAGYAAVLAELVPLPGGVHGKK